MFAFTYLWIAANQFLKAGDHAFGWFCFFIAVTAVPTGIYTLHDAHENPASGGCGVVFRGLARRASGACRLPTGPAVLVVFGQPFPAGGEHRVITRMAEDVV